MPRHTSSPRILLTIVFLLTVTPMVHSAHLLTDAELDALGAGGGGSVKQSEEGDYNLLSDATLDTITAQGLHGTVWPFQYAPLKLPGKRISWSSRQRSFSDVGAIDLGPAFYGYGSKEPPSPRSAGFANSFLLPR